MAGCPADDLTVTIGDMPATPRRPLPPWPPLRWPRLRRPPLGAWTALIWCGAAAAGLRGYSGLPGMPRGLPALPAWSWPLLTAAVALALAGSALLRRWPLPALGLLVAGSVALMLAVSPAGVALPGTAWLQLLFGIPVSFGYTTLSNRWSSWLTFSVMPAVVAGLAGRLVRQSREYARRLSAQAADQAVTAERLRIARELHDMVAHSVGIIALQAGAAARVADTQPARAREAMLAVESTGRETLAGLRRMLGPLRAAAPGPGGAPGLDGGAAGLHPAPGLADVERLAADTTAAGVRVNVRWCGQRRPLPPDIDLSAYRIIQESVTNVVRHAGTHSCQVSVEYRDQEIAIEVADSGQGCGKSPRAGYGLAGMRERVALLHGQFTAGPRSGGGFCVSARLPVPEGAGAG